MIAHGKFRSCHGTSPSIAVKAGRLLTLTIHHQLLYFEGDEAGALSINKDAHLAKSERT
jgi:hypothetical protein